MAQTGRKGLSNAMKSMFMPLAIAVILICVPWARPGRAGHHRIEAPSNNINWKPYQDMAVDLMQQYLRVNTSNPPGNEIAAARFLKSVLDREGIQSDVFEYNPGRANIIARIKGERSKRPLV